MAESAERKKPFFLQDFSSGPDQRRVVLSAIIDAVERAGLHPLLSMDELTLVLDEALTNAMEHGNRWDPMKKVVIQLLHDAGYLHILIEDEGSGFIPGNPPSDFEKGNKLSRRGRGLSLIRQFCEPVWDVSGRRIDLPLKTL